MKRFLLLAVAIMTFATGFAQQMLNCHGTVVDETGEPLIGVTVSVKGTSAATPTDLDGMFDLKVPKGTKELSFTYVGYSPLNLPAQANMGVITMKPDSKMLQDVVVTQSIARTRETPVAISELTAGEIEAKLGNQELPEVLKTTPGVWATPSGGGFGDAKINMRGFQAANVAVVVNGIPMNDMEWGGIYWSNFAGLSDVTSNMQTQRGLGASLLSAPSVGGTINITTHSLDAKKGGKMWYGIGNDGMNNVGFSLSTGLMDNGWAITVLGSRKWGEGYIQGTQYEAWNYFANVSKKIGDSHQLSLTAFGAPQWHNQRNNANGLTVEGWQEVKQYMNGESQYRYNPVYGFDNEGHQRTSNRNQYHKPIISLNHIWQINERSSLSTAAYVSLATGGGYSGQGRGTYEGKSITYTSWYGANNGILETLFRRPDGTFDYGAIQDMNAASTTGSNMVMSESNNNHEWYGLVSTYKNEVIQNTLTLTGGIDFRYYVGHHNNKIIDLYSGEYYMDDSDRKNVNAANNAAALDPNWVYEKLGVGDIVYRNYNGHTHQEGIYAQAEYKALEGALTTILSGSLSNTGYQRIDHFYYDDAHAKSDALNFMGGTIKAGANYNINRHNNVFINGGYISKAPFFSGGAFLQSTTSNATNPNALNEKIGTIEIGYGFHSPVFSATLNGYWTKWIDKTSTRSGDITTGEHAGERFYMNMEGVNARHMGLELNFKWIPARWIDIDGMLSLGDWVWDSDATGYFYNEQGQPLKNLQGDLAEGVLAPDHAKAILNQKGVHVGGSAQTTGAIGVTFKPFKGFRIGGDWTFNARNYSDYQINASNFTPGGVINVAEPWRIPWGNQFDMSCSYAFKMAGLDATIYGNVYNLFNYYYVKDAYTSSDTPGTWQNAYRIFYSFGRTFSVRLKISF
ncbi:MAG: TonB-dependent receptor [Muribaculaceae bacterium]|nr:TonB-dependent receptor [Muribaculaceae bacterium]